MKKLLNIKFLAVGFIIAVIDQPLGSPEFTQQLIAQRWYPHASPR